MRHFRCALLGVLFTVSATGYGQAQDARSWWRPFSKSEEQSQAATEPAAEPAAEAAPAAAEPERSASKWPAMPKVRWPKLSTPSGPHSVPRTAATRAKHRGRPVARRNSWAHPAGHQRPSSAGTSSSWQSVTDGAQRLGQSTRTAWHKTLDVIVPSGEPAAATPNAAAEPRVAWWKRPWVSEAEQPESPRTVSEWMAQDRLDP